MHVCKQIEENLKRQKRIEIINVLQKCHCNKCTQLSRSWNALEYDVLQLPYNTGDACVPLEIIMHMISMKYGSTGKSTIHKLGQISNCYPKNSDFHVGVSQHKVYSVLPSILSGLSESEKISLIAPSFCHVTDGNCNGLSAIHFVDGD